MRDKQANRRIRLLLAIFVLAFAGTLARAVWLQGVNAAHLARMAERQHRETVKIPAGRGTIFDRTGVQLAIGEQTTTVYADPRQVRAPRAVAVAAQQILGVNANELYPQLLDKRRGFVYVQRFADPAKAALLAKKGLAGLGFYAEERRAYPQHTVAAQVVGYAGVDNKGLAGLEVLYDRQHESGALAGEVDAGASPEPEALDPLGEPRRTESLRERDRADVRRAREDLRD